MNAFVNTESSCLGFVSSWFYSNDAQAPKDPDVKRLHSLAILGTDIYNTGLRMEENQLRKNTYNARMHEIVHDNATLSEQYSLYLRCKELDTEYNTLSRAMNILSKTSESVDNRMLMKRMQHVMQEAIQRHGEMNEDGALDEVEESEAMQHTFQRISETNQYCSDALTNMSNNVRIVDQENNRNALITENAEHGQYHNWRTDFLRKDTALKSDAVPSKEAVLAV